MTLERRTQAFDEMSRRFACKRPSKLISIYKAPEPLWNHLRFAAMTYMSACLPGSPIIQDEKELLGLFETEQKRISNITPNGMIVPKRHLVLEYNLLVRAFARIVDSMNIQDLIVSWHVPLNLRIKFAEASADNLKRHHPTEHIHSDSWAGESAESVTTHIPIFGDADRNHMLFYDPPADFQEEWLGPRPTYLDGAEIASRYTKLPDYPKKGELAVADFSSLHASHRDPGSGTRVSIDTTFVLRKAPIPGTAEVIHPWREGERSSHCAMSGLGESHLFYFPDTMDQQVDSAGGFKHPTNLHILELKI